MKLNVKKWVGTIFRSHKNCNEQIGQTRKQQVQINFIRAKLEKSERSGFTEDTKEQILKQSKSLFNS